MVSRLIDTSNYFTIITTIKEDPNLVQRAIEKRSLLFQRTFKENQNTICEDKDLFDNYYQHLLVIKKEGEEVVAGYRFAYTEEILNKFGLNGFYTYKIFDYTEEFFKYIGPSLEFGRMFICDAYQKKGIVFKLLWQSIAKYLFNNKRLRYFYGSLSLPSNFDLNALIWIAIFCKTHRFDIDIEQKITARYPCHIQLLDKNLCFSLSDKEIDLNSKDLLNLTSAFLNYTSFRELNLAFEMHYQKKYPFPTLLRNYEKLGAHFSVFGKNPCLFNSSDIFVTTPIGDISPDFIKHLIGNTN